IHYSFCHNDLSPNNIIVETQGARCYVLDWNNYSVACDRQEKCDPRARKKLIHHRQEKSDPLQAQRWKKSDPPAAGDRNSYFTCCLLNI
ncbi:MAG: phosphotransferase, partial [Clostridia bacterium]|nr:phosphotransferase [Clostridia bacterium]